MAKLSSWKDCIKKYRVFVVLGVLVVAAIIWAAVQSRVASVYLAATSADANGRVAPDTAFRLETKRKPSVEELRDVITVEPETAYDLSEKSPGVYELIPLKGLDAGSEISFTIYKSQFSFIVQNRLEVLSAFPANDSVNVPVESGIEFTFNSRNLTPERFETAFRISPETKGSFHHADGRYVFQPEALLYDTAYTVTLGTDLITEDDAALGEAYELSFRTISETEQELQAMFQISGNGFSVNSLSGETPLVQAYIDQSIATEEQTVSVELHAFDGWESYLSALQAGASKTRRNMYASASLSIPVEGLREHAAFDIQPIPAQSDSENDRGAWILQFPEPLPEGWYAATYKLRVGDETAVRQQFLQVSDLSVFYMVYDEDFLVWINDAATGQPVKSAEFAITGAYEAAGTTGADGTVHIENGSPPSAEEENDEVSTYCTVKAGERVFVDTDMYYNYYTDGGAEARQYMSYLFTDRPLYHTTDTVQAWGMVRPRAFGGSPPEDLRLVLGDDAVSQEIELRPDGTFTATLELENLTANYWKPLKIMTGEVELHSLSLRIEDFVKPVYTATASTEKPVYLFEEDFSVGVGVDVSTFDGTPISGFGLHLSAWGDTLVVNGENLLTDKSGHARADIRVTADPDTWYPQQYSFQFSSTDAQDENFYLTETAYGIHRDVMLLAQPDLKSGGTTVAVSTHRVDISRIQTPEQIWEKDALKGQALSIPVTGSVYKVYYEKVKSGTHYDFVNRVSVDSYRYERREEAVDSLEFTTENGSYTLRDLPASTDEACYFIKLQAKDSRGKTVETTAYLGDLYYRYSGHDNGNHRYNLVKQTDPANAVLNESHGSTEYDSQRTHFDDGEEVVYQLLDNDLPVESMEGRLLFSVVQDQFSNVTVSSSDQVKLPFSEELLPNYILTGAYFDGRHIFALENTYMYFNPRKRELAIELKPDKDAYRPSEEMAVEATVTNQFTGEPAADTAVVLSVVDEAVFAIEEQNPNILSRLYESIYYPYIRKYTSYLQLDLGGPGEKGGGGDKNMRTEFEDTAYFSVGTTDKDGNVRFEYKLPDNITSWRLTSLALNPENHAGNTKSNVVSTKEFFILPVVNDILLEGDSFSVGVYGAGSQVADADKVNYTITVEGAGKEKSERKVSATLREYAGVTFDPLAPGDYTLTIAAECGSYQDGVQLPVSVVKSGVEVSLVKSVNLKDGLAVDSLRYPVDVTFYAAGGKTYNTVFRSVCGISSGGRADMRLAKRFIALQFQKEGSSYASPALEEDYSDLSGYDMLSLLPYSEPDLELTVKARLALPELVDAGSLRGLTPANLSEYSYSGAASSVYLAQALAGETVSANLADLLTSGRDLDFVDQMYLVLAMAISGDTEGAEEWYGKLVKPHLAELSGLGGDTALYVDLPDSPRSQADCTAAASLLASALSTDEATGLVRYLAEKKSALEPYLFEQIYYLQQYPAAGDGSASFRYVRDGEEQTVELSRRFTSLSFNRQQLAEADFTVLSGDVYADVYYTGAPDQTADADKKKIGFTKTVEPVDGSLTVGSLVKITLTPDFSAFDTDIGDTMLVVDDYIPTGMRFERYDYQFERYSGNRGWYLNSRQGQRLQFTVYGLGYRGVKPLVYYARCATPGDYVVESAYITSASGDTWGASDRDMVQIP